MKCMLNILGALSIAILLGGCAHPIAISPSIDNLKATTAQPRIDKSVGYFISDGNKALEVTTAAGGGDKVKYTPYADLESGLYKVLSNVFSNVNVVKDLNDQAYLQSNNISWVFVPTITTSSSSRNAFFWPPTDFVVTIECVATDALQQQVWSTTVKAENDVIAVNATLHEHGLAGKLAAEKALRKLQEEIMAAPEFRK